MEIAQIMKRLSDSRTTNQEAVKTASVKPSNGTGSPDQLRAALRQTLAVAPSTEKTAAAPSENPAGSLLKLAEDLTNAEEEAMMKQASIYGAAMCDGFMNRFAQYDDAAAQVAPASVKTASVYQGYDPALETIKTAAADPEFKKFASANPELVKEAYDLGYQQTMGTLVKQAQDDFDAGYSDTMQEIHKVASHAYVQGARTINTVLRSMQA